MIIGKDYEKRIERVTVAGTSNTGGKTDPARDRIVKRAAKEFKDGMYVNLGKSFLFFDYFSYCFVSDCSFSE